MKAIERAAINYVKDICPGVFKSASVDRIILDKTNLYDKSATIMAHVLVNEGLSDAFQIWVEIEADVKFTNLRVVR